MQRSPTEGLYISTDLLDRLADEQFTSVTSEDEL